MIGVEILLIINKIYEILEVSYDGERAYELKSWLNLSGFVVGDDKYELAPLILYASDERRRLRSITKLIYPSHLQLNCRH